MWMRRFVRVRILEIHGFSGLRQRWVHCWVTDIYDISLRNAGMTVDFAKATFSSLKLKRPPTIFIHKHATLKQSAEI